MRVLYTLFVLFALSLDGQAQKVIVKKKSASPKVIEPHNKSATPVASSGRWAIKYNLTTLFIGEFPISAEYALTDYMTAEVGIGLLHANYLGNAFGGPFSTFSNWGDFEGIGSCNDCDLSYGLTVSYTARLRFFPDYDYFDGGFIGLGFNYRPYEGTYSYAGNTAEAEWYSKVSELNILFGSQYDNGSNFLFEYYYGAGIQFKNMLVPVEYYDFVNPDITTIIPTKSSGTNLSLLFGIMIGFIPN